MPPYDPFSDSSLSWALVRVHSCEPSHPTWRHPGVVTFVVEEVLRGTLPPRFEVLFGPPREASQERFYALRDATPEQAATNLAALDARTIPVPAVGARVIVWLAVATPPPAGPPVTSPPHPTPAGPPPPTVLPPGMSVPAPLRSEGLFSIPTLRSFGPSDLPLRQRWIDHSDAVMAAVRARLGV